MASKKQWNGSKNINKIYLFFYILYSKSMNNVITGYNKQHYTHTNIRIDPNPNDIETNTGYHP
jgi:hypothetical protein